MKKWLVLLSVMLSVSLYQVYAQTGRVHSQGSYHCKDYNTGKVYMEGGRKDDGGTISECKCISKNLYNNCLQFDWVVVRVPNIPPPPPTIKIGVIFYEDIRFSGASEGGFLHGRYASCLEDKPWHGGSSNKIYNDQITSMKIPPGLKVVVWEHCDKRGAKEVFRGNVQYVGDWWNDKISSFEVLNDR